MFLSLLFILFLLTALPIFFFATKLNISFVTKKKIGNAVKRNKIKRRLRNITNEAVKNISINYNYSFLVIAKPSMLNNEYKNIKETLFRDLEKIK